MAIEPVVSVNIVGQISSLDKALIEIIKSELVHLDYVKNKSNLKNFESLNEKNPYSAIMEKTKKIFNMLNLTPNYNDYSSLQNKTNEEFSSIINEYYTNVENLVKQIESLKVKLRIMNESFQQLKNFQKFGLNTNSLFSASFVESHFGRLPIDSYAKLSCFEEDNFFFILTEQDETYCWGFLISLKSESEKIEKIVQSLFFESQYSSKNLSENFKLSTNEIEQQIIELENKLKLLESNLNDFKIKNSQLLLSIYSKIKTQHDAFFYRKFVLTNKKFFFIKGFVLKKNIETLNSTFEEFDDVMIEIPKESTSEEEIKPVKLKTFSLFKPFELLIKTFGTPNYNSLNPTGFVGFIYCFLFGIMFGDLGQGLFLSLCSFIMWKLKKSDLGLILIRCGLTSAVFGTIYDSVFGFEGLLTNFWKSLNMPPFLPFNLLKGKNAVVILIASLILGMTLIIFSIILNIYISLKNKQFLETIFASNGFAGLTIYGSFTFAAVNLLLFKKNIVSLNFLVFFVVVPIILIFLKEPVLIFIEKNFFKKEVSQKFEPINSTFETFEALMNFITNTLSFLRVGGFAMSHAALMLVVVKFCEKCSNLMFVSPLIAIFGNVFVVALEGLVVSIQVLRLVYYEIFSRFYKSDGIEFQPARVKF